MMNSFKKICLCVLLIALLFCGCNAGVIEGAPPVPQTESTVTQATTQSSTTEKPSETTTEESTSTTADNTTKATTATTQPTETTAKETTVPSTVDSTVLSTQAPSETTSERNTCTLTIECKSILKHMDMLAKGHSQFVPKSGYILNEYTVKLRKDDTAYDILKRACNDNGIDFTPEASLYGIYISGINNLDEFDCGNESGWLYKVNGSFPNVACSKYTVSEGDEIVFTYTCKKASD